MAEAKETKYIAVPSKSVSLGSPKEMIDFATQLKTFIIREKLFTPIAGKNYVNVEGWQFAGAATGILPIIRSLSRVDTAENEISYRCEVELKQYATALGVNDVVGRGVAICSSKENGRGNHDEYVIASMAQTRAIGKAYRNTFAWLMKMAGYEPTPAEEVANFNPNITIKIKDATTKQDLQELLKGLDVSEQKNAAPLINERLKELGDAEVN